MNTITHALLPVIAAALYERSYLVEEQRRLAFSTKRLIVIGIFGAAPDILNPHISLDARYTSWSHGIVFWVIITMCLVILHLTRRKVFPIHLMAWLSGSYLLHIGCDAISGGIAWNYPFGRSVIGAFYVNPIWWIPLDVLLSILAYGLFRAIPSQRQLRTKDLG
jgi:membrane-bound metal-dependent hydrolase YbcI (DUF457 family)